MNKLVIIIVIIIIITQIVAMQIQSCENVIRHSLIKRPHFITFNAHVSRWCCMGNRRHVTSSDVTYRLVWPAWQSQRRSCIAIVSLTRMVFRSEVVLAHTQTGQIQMIRVIHMQIISQLSLHRNHDQ